MTTHTSRPTSRLAAITWLLMEAAVQWWQDNALRLSAAVSYYAVLSLAPLLAIIIRVMALAHATQFARRRLIEQATYVMGKQAADAIEPIINTNEHKSFGHLATIISTVVLLYSATSVFMELRNSMNTIWGVDRKPHPTNPAKHAVLNFIRSRLLSLAMVFGLGCLLVFFMLISGFLSAVEHRIMGVDRWPAYLAELAASGAVEFALFCLLFKFLPEIEMKWQSIWHGALIAAILFSAGRFGLAIYFKYSRMDNVYGAAGSFVAILTWIYYSAFSLFYGAEFAKVLTRCRAFFQNQ